MKHLCEYKEFTRQRCRRTRAFFIGYKVPFGFQVGPHGDIPVFALRVTGRCETHKSKDIGGEVVGVLPVENVTHEED